jgi:hypothetical protein
MLELVTLYLGMLVVIEPTLYLDRKMVMLEVLTLYLGMLIFIEPTLYLDKGHAGNASPLPGHAGSHSASPPAPSLARAC